MRNRLKVKIFGVGLVTVVIMVVYDPGCGMMLVNVCVTGAQDQGRVFI